jgi:hypothetical protein
MAVAAGHDRVHKVIAALNRGLSVRIAANGYRDGE